MVRPELCDGCLDCEKACEKLYGAKRLNIVKVDECHFLLNCQQCEVPVCAEVCPVGAYREVNGIRTVIWERCLGCGLCYQACPFGALNLTHGKPVQKCDLCMGQPLPDSLTSPDGSLRKSLNPGSDYKPVQPACLKACTNGAITKLDLECLNRQRQQDFLAKSQLVSGSSMKKEMNYLSQIFS